MEDVCDYIDSWLKQSQLVAKERQAKAMDAFKEDREKEGTLKIVSCMLSAEGLVLSAEVDRAVRSAAFNDALDKIDQFEQIQINRIFNLWMVGDKYGDLLTNLLLMEGLCGGLPGKYSNDAMNSEWLGWLNHLHAYVRQKKKGGKMGHELGQRLGYKGGLHACPIPPPSHDKSIHLPDRRDVIRLLDRLPIMEEILGRPDWWIANRETLIRFSYQNDLATKNVCGDRPYYEESETFQLLQLRFFSVQLEHVLTHCFKPPTPDSVPMIRSQLEWLIALDRIMDDDHNGVF